MKKRKYRILLIFLSLFAIVCATSFPAVGEVFGLDDSESLTIRGEGVKMELVLMRGDLEEMPNVKYEYSTANNFPTEKAFYREGVSLEHLLGKAGIKESAKIVKFTSSDGYSKTFTLSELLDEDRYCFKEDGSKAKVANIIALSDSHKGFESLSPIELSLTVGQRVKGEQNNPWFVKYLKTIEVLESEPGSWEEVGFVKKHGPDGVSVTLNHPNIDSVKIYYTLDGSSPGINSKVYNVSATYYQPHLNKPISVVKDTEIRAIAIGPGKTESPVASTAISFGSSGFVDITDYAWARLAIESLVDKKIISGMGDGRFAPGETLTRAQFATMMVLAMGESPSNPKDYSVTDPANFSDVNPNQWHYGYVKKAAEKGWIKGYTDGSFMPEKPLSREEMITIVVQSMGTKDISKEDEEKILNSFSKDSKISDWAKEYVVKAEQMGILEHGNLVLSEGGELTFNSQKYALRAEAAVTVYKLLNVKQ
jgi:hypothetical protein